MPEKKYEDIVIMEIRLDALRQQIVNAMMLRHEEIEGIIKRKLDEVLSTQAIVNRVGVEVEKCVNAVVYGFFCNTGLGYSLLYDEVEKKLKEVLLAQLGKLGEPEEKGENGG